MAAIARPSARTAAEGLSLVDGVGIVACGLPLVAALLLAFRAGGFFFTDWGVGEIALLAVLAVACIAVRGRQLGVYGGVALGGWIALAVWQGISASWAPDASLAFQEMHRTLLYAAAFALGFVGLRRRAWLGRMIEASIAGAFVVALAAVAPRLLPGVGSAGVTARLSAPITYWNGLGVLVVVGAILALGVAADLRRRRAVRAVAAGLVPLFLLDLLLTFSRGATAALLLGLSLLVWLAADRLGAFIVVAAVGAVTAPLLLFANAQPSVARLTTAGSALPSEAHRILLALVVTVAASAVVGVAAGRATAGITVRRRRLLARALASGGAVALAAAVLAISSGNPFSWTHRQFDSFRRFDPGARNSTETISGRLAVAGGSGRWQFWSVAAHQFRAAPVRGAGAGSFRFAWTERRPVDISAQNAHSLYLETLGDTGLVGLLLLVLPPAAVLAAVARRRRVGRNRVRHEAAVIVAAGGALAAHLAVDWDWQLPAVVLPLLVLGGGLLRASTPKAPTVAHARWAACVALWCPVAVVLAVGPLASARAVDVAKADAAAGKLAPALSAAHHAVRLDGGAPGPRLVTAYILRDLGRNSDADAAFGAALQRSPRDWEISADWAEALLARGDIDAAAVLVKRAQQLDPLEPRVQILANIVRADLRQGG